MGFEFVICGRKEGEAFYGQPSCRVYSVHIMDESKVREIGSHYMKDFLSQFKDLVSSSIPDLKRSSDGLILGLRTCQTHG